MNSLVLIIPVCIFILVVGIGLAKILAERTLSHKGIGDVKHG